MTFDRKEYEEFVAAMIEDERPRMFAVLREYGECEDAEVVAWGFAWTGHATALLPGGNVLRSGSADRAARVLERGHHGPTRLVWMDHSA
ncbi:hypothetical protein F4559_005211 [Saccharothrix violaceirubra]|uniref:Uncharacterized protein n=2 Tax=Saccharothrix violaceirubra TaxID=413306 RepID=A0A7W7T770_9PSEU|nr:hypothetical protein [Saccharothrix violaceirubra]